MREQDQKDMDQKQLTDAVTRYYDSQKEDRNLLLGRENGIVNHHFGIGDFDHTQVEWSQKEISLVLNVLELNQIDLLLTFMGDVKSSHMILDAGCGRGGTAFVIAGRYRAMVHGVTISSYQKGFATSLAEQKGLSSLAQFHEMDYLKLTFDDGTFDHVVTNESTQYVVHLSDLFKGFARVLKKGGRYTIATWCLDDSTEECAEADRINEHYGTTMHKIGEYVASLNSSGFENIIKADLTEMALPYFVLRSNWAESAGIEKDFIKGFTTRRILYYFITTVRS